MPATLPTRKIGQDDVSAIGFGLMGIGTNWYGPNNASDEERLKVLDFAFEHGCTNWDTSDVYGDSEDLVRKWLERTGKRDQIFLATKFGITPTAPNGTPEYVKEAAEKTLKRLGVETVDLYYLHRADPKVPIEKSVGAMAELVKEGKVRYLGLSEVTEKTLRRAHAVHPIAALQVEYSPFFLDIEEEKIGLLKACRELGVAVVAYSPLGRGLLTGVYKSADDIPADDFRKRIPKFGEENFPNILKLVDKLEELGKKHNATASQVTLAWLLAQGDDIIPIPGTKKIKYLEENINALKVKLSPEEITHIREVANAANALTVGDRYPASSMQWVLVESPEL
ncbi:Aldo/keto reductase [Pholiota conissans]|uniref:Aldo/keto reductase n=1 Tax=Pholiota conissans TaxID=109636 RepID=A0A9P5ZEZ3_9AGAR|nr:Aldo/keto reductase [Pholiota conissans]